MKETTLSGLDALIYDAIVEVKEVNSSFNKAEKEFYDENRSVDIQKAMALKDTKERLIKASWRLYDVLTAKRVLEELKRKGVEI